MSKKIKLLQILFFTLFAIPSHSKAIFTPEMREELCARKRQHISAPPITLLPEGSVDWFHDIGDFASRGRFAFNNAPELLGSIAYLVRNHHIDMIIETGTFKGHTTLGLALLTR